MKDSGVEWIGAIPHSWKVRRLKHLTNGPLAYGVSVEATESVEGDPRLIRTTDIDDRGRLRSETIKTVPIGLARDFMLLDGDLLLTRSGATVGKSLLFRSLWGPACHAGYLVRVRPDGEQVLPEYLKFFAESDAFWAQVRVNTIQATIQNVSAAKYADFVVPTPPLPDQVAITERLKRISDVIETTRVTLQGQISLLTEYRQALITAAVTGQLDEATLKGHKPADDAMEFEVPV
jgi:type I restriction enzyme S subunit